ncbi:MAG: hypothetical protein WD801_14220 [Gemmatimonadaceae bacterium]
MTNRARNAMNRPAFIGAISVGTFVTALVSMVIVPRAQQREAVPIPTVTRPDTLSLAVTAAMARVQFASADSALTAVRMDAQAQAAWIDAELARVVVDTLAEARRDSLAVRLRALDMMVARAEQAPLASSYRALAEMPALRNDSRVLALLDSLSDVERERDGFGAVGGVDPIFVALTSRANEIGRTIQGVANQRRGALRAEIARLEAPPTVVEMPVIDSASHLAARDSARATLDASLQELVRLRVVSRTLDLEEQRAREQASAIAPPVALLAAAFVLSAVFGFGTALMRELRRPRVSTAHELERFLGVRVLSTVEPPMPSAERGRRQADRAAPPYFDPAAEGYQLAYLALATEHPALLAVTVSGDDPAIAAVVACNLAAVAVDEARTTLVIDLEPTGRAAAALRSRSEPGITDILRQDATWPDATVEASVGRDKSVALVPFGGGPPASVQEIATLLTRDASRMARYYDAVVAVAASDAVGAGLAAALPSPEVVYCAQPGITPLRELRDLLERIRATGGVVRGLVLWTADRPLLPVDGRPKQSGRSPVSAARGPQTADQVA